MLIGDLVGTLIVLFIALRQSCRQYVADTHFVQPAHLVLPLLTGMRQVKIFDAEALNR